VVVRHVEHRPNVETEGYPSMSIPRQRSGCLPATRALFVVTLLASSASGAAAQDAEGPVTPDRPTISDFGKNLTDTEAGALLAEMSELLRGALAASGSAAEAASVAEVKQGAARAVEAVWGISPGVSGTEVAEVERLGWK